MSRKLVLFDIDGTILVTAGAGRRAIVRALGEMVGATHAFGGIRFDGKTDPQIVSELLAAAGREPPHDAAQVTELCDRYVTLLEHELASPDVEATVMPGVPELLDRLDARDDVLLGLLTGNLERGATLKLRAAGFEPDRFVVGAYGSDAADRGALPAIAATRAAEMLGAAPSGHAVVIIGDTPADIACGAGIGARAIAVATGGYTVEDLARHAPHAVFPDLSDTERVLAAILD